MSNDTRRPTQNQITNWLSKQPLSPQAEQNQVKDPLSRRKHEAPEAPLQKSKGVRPSKKPPSRWLQFSKVFLLPLVAIVVAVAIPIWQSWENKDQQQEDILVNYIKDTSDLIFSHNLITSHPDTNVLQVARSRTLMALRRLNPDRKVFLIQFLRESKLITIQSKNGKAHSPLDLRYADLNSIIVPSNIPSDDPIDLDHTNLTDAHMNGDNLTGSNLNGATLIHIELRHSVMQSSDLSNADLTHADLTSADLTHADLTGADLTGADLTGADLTSADLTYANLTGTHITCDQIKKARYNKTHAPTGINCSPLRLPNEK